MEMPGVDKANLDINVENDVLSVAGRIDFSKYEKLQPVYAEYNIGHYRRSFSLAPNSVDQENALGSRNVEGQDAVTEVGFDSVRIDLHGQCDHSVEISRHALSPVNADLVAIGDRPEILMVFSLA